MSKPRLTLLEVATLMAEAPRAVTHAEFAFWPAATQEAVGRKWAEANRGGQWRGCGTCRHLGEALPSGVAYCTRWAMWRWPSEEPACGTWSKDLA